MQTLITLLRPFVAIVAHRAGPQDLPYSGLLLGLTAAAHTLLHLGGLLLLDVDAARAVAVPLLDTLLQAAFFGVLLGAMGLRQRLTQTLTAVFGANFLLNLVAVPVALAGTADPVSPGGAFSAIVAIVLMLWSLGVKGHILRHAAGFPYFLGVMIALGFFVAFLMLEMSLFGTPG